MHSDLAAKFSKENVYVNEFFSQIKPVYSLEKAMQVEGFSNDH